MEPQSIISGVINRPHGQPIPGKVEDFAGKIDGGGFKGVMAIAKNPLELISPRFLWALAGVLLHGAKKYAKNNWMRGMSWTTVYGGIMRHLTAWFMGEDIDKESGLPHLHHAACGLMFLIHYTTGEEYKHLDDRVFKQGS